MNFLSMKAIDSHHEPTHSIHVNFQITSESNEENVHFIEHYSFDSRELPYIETNNLPLELFIDTKATKSLKSPKMPETCFNNYIQNEPFVISTVFQNYENQALIVTVLFQEFKQNSNKKFLYF